MPSHQTEAVSSAFCSPIVSFCCGNDDAPGMVPTDGSSPAWFIKSPIFFSISSIRLPISSIRPKIVSPI